uniref:PHD-type zinc finger plants domain-containing protein n=1 Tax=Oryza meridionalis TaxID=40149 RepID=A0A0E0CPB7_9ORYZ
MAMASGGTVCSMCGDVGFPDKLFRCARCRRRFQHSYCTNYYGDGAPVEAGAGVCDWCLSDAAIVAGKKGPSLEGNEETFSREYRGRNKQAASTGGGEQEGGGGGRRVSKAGAVRRYKLLKDVLC